MLRKFIRFSVPVMPEWFHGFPIKVLRTLCFVTMVAERARSCLVTVCARGTLFAPVAVRALGEIDTIHLITGTGIEDLHVPDAGTLSERSQFVKSIAAVVR